MIGKVVTGCVAILPYHTATQDRGSECRDFGFISRIVTALVTTCSAAVLVRTGYIIRTGRMRNKPESFYLKSINAYVIKSKHLIRMDQ